MGGGSVADLVDALHDGVERGVISDGRVGAVEVVVDGAGQAYAGQIELVGKNACSGERSVASDHHQGVDAVAFDIVIGQLTAFGCGEFRAACCLEDCAAELYDVADVLGLEILYLVGDQTLVAAIDALYLKSGEDGRACDGADGCVHSGSVASRSEDAYAFDF